MTRTPERRARLRIDVDLAAAGWVIVDRDELDLTAGRGIAVREFAMMSGFGFADYLLYVDRKAAGAIEAKAEGTLTGVESQAAKRGDGLPLNLPAHRRPCRSCSSRTARKSTSLTGSTRCRAAAAG